MKKLKTFILVLIFVVLAALCWLAIINKQPKQIKPDGSTGDIPQEIEQSKTHRFVYFADTRGSNNGVNADVLNKAFKRIKLLNPQPEYIIVGGDLVGGCDDINIFKSQLLNFKRIAQTYYPPEKILPAVGNHEMLTKGNGIPHEEIFSNIFSEFRPSSELIGYNKSVYYVDIGEVRLIVLNSFHQAEYNQISPTQLEWLKQSTKAEGKIKFVFLHSPAYPTGADVGASLDQNPKLRDNFWQVIDKNNVMAVFCGHEHNYSRRLIDKSFNTKYAVFKRTVNQIIAGTAGAPIYKQYTSSKGVVVPPKLIYNYVVMDVGKDITSLKAYSVDGLAIDDFSIKNIY